MPIGLSLFILHSVVGKTASEIQCPSLFPSKLNQEEEEEEETESSLRNASNNHNLIENQ